MRVPALPLPSPAAERKPVGYANCMLSVANFNEALRVPQVGLGGCMYCTVLWLLLVKLADVAQGSANFNEALRVPQVGLAD